jgi:hypothetical protein
MGSLISIAMDEVGDGIIRDGRAEISDLLQLVKIS